jgi:hypothetical protein
VPAALEFIEPGDQLIGLKRAGDVIALGDIAPEIPQQPQLLFGLDPFGGDRQPQAVGEVDNAFDDQRAVL